MTPEIGYPHPRLMSGKGPPGVVADWPRVLQDFRGGVTGPAIWDLTAADDAWTLSYLYTP